MLSFESDYIAGAHPKVLESLLKTNLETLSGYGSDCYTERAKERIRTACGKSDADVHFLVGGTQTNSIVIASMLHDTEGVVAAQSGHVGTHEAGAIEYTGHKVLTLPQHDGKIAPDELEAYLADFHSDENREHMVWPGMVYISHPTEYGPLYTKAELSALSDICRRYEIPLYLDGARLGYGLASPHTDVTIRDVAELCDVFYIGGTKVGALCGEAVVFSRARAPKHFTTLIKQHGALLAKGRLLGVQFDTLFEDGLYFAISRHAIEMAERLEAILREKGYEFYIESPTNQKFVVLTDDQYQQRREQVAMSFWEKSDETHTVVRLATSWSTTAEDISKLREIL